MVTLCYSEPLHPAPRNVLQRIRRGLVMTLLSILIPPYMLYAYLFQRSFLDPIMAAAKRESIKLDNKYQDPELLKRVWSTKVGQIYLQSDLEYQRQEGYCSSATMRNILKSIGISSLPPAKSGASTPVKYVEAIDRASNGLTNSSIVYGSEGYDAFMCAVKKANDPNYRVAVNFLRSPLFGITQPSYLPINFLFALFGGHFSVIVGYLEDEDLVAVFDVNHTYGPYLVDSKRLYDAVNSYDKMANNTRALIVSHSLKTSQVNNQRHVQKLRVTRFRSTCYHFQIFRMDQALVEQPPRKGFWTVFLQVCSMLAGIIVLPIIGILSLPTLLFLFIFKRSVLQPVIQASKYEEFEQAPHYKDPALLNRVWSTPVGQQYLSGDLEYQQREGYCAIASQRNILKSLPQYPAAHLPPATLGAATAQQFAQLLDERSHGRTTSTVIYGDEGFDAFYQTIKLSNDTDYRVAVNFLHATLSGTGPIWLPWNLLFGVVSGHFSVILGYLEEEDLVAVFDVNASYGPYLVETRRLYEAVAAQDVSSNRSRGLILSKINPPESIVDSLSMPAQTRKPPIPKFKRTSKKKLGDSVADEHNAKVPSLSLRIPSPTNRIISEKSFKQLQQKCFQLKPPPSPVSTIHSIPVSPKMTVNELSMLPSECASRNHPCDDALWEQKSIDIQLLQTKLHLHDVNTTSQPRAAYTFGCKECGSKDLTAFCWKGCRNFTSLEEFNGMYKQLLKRNQYLESLVVTQEKDLIDMEMAKTESNQTMLLIRDELSRVHKMVINQYEVNKQKESPETRPAWAVMGVKSMVYKFDLDGDYLLSMNEMNNLKKALGHSTLYTDDTFQALITRYCFEAQPCLPSDSSNNRVAIGLTPEGVMQLYETLGLDSLEQDLKALGIYIGRADDCTIDEVRDIIADLEVNFKACNESRAKLRAEVDEKARAIVRLRENLVDVSAQVVQHREECNVAITSSKRLQDEVEALQEKHENYVHSNVISKAEMVSSQDAVVEMRSLLEAQISETEVWQRHCWELQEQLSAIMESCSAHKKDLWKAKDAKKEEERKNMLLYMQLQHGKKHVQVEH